MNVHELILWAQPQESSHESGMVMAVCRPKPRRVYREDVIKYQQRIYYMYIQIRCWPSHKMKTESFPMHATDFIWPLIHTFNLKDSYKMNAFVFSDERTCTRNKHFPLWGNPDHSPQQVWGGQQNKEKPIKEKPQKTSRASSQILAKIALQERRTAEWDFIKYIYKFPATGQHNYICNSRWVQINWVCSWK